MGRCRKCKGRGMVYYDPTSSGIIMTCDECGGSGTDEKPQCPMHKISHKYSGSIGWHCPDCKKFRKYGFWDQVYYPE